MAGGLVGDLTRPQAAEIGIGPLSVEVQGDRPAGARGGELTGSQMQLVGIFAVAGFGLGFVADRRRA